MDPVHLPIAELAPLLRRRKLSPVELTRAFLARIERLQPRFNAFITVTPERALADARRAEREIRRGKDRGPLHGIPIALKDNIHTRGIRTTAGSQILAGFVPAEDALVAERLAHAGAVLLGKTNLHEFAYGVSTENPHYGPTRNPWDATCIPGGSSGGSAAALAAGICCASLGSDTGGSIRIPAAHCGVVGLKPTYGVVSAYGVVPLSRTLDHVGPLAKSVADAQLLFAAVRTLGARYPAHARQLCHGLPLPRALDRGKRSGKLHGLILGWPQNYFFDHVDVEIQKAIEAVARFYEGAGARVIPVDVGFFHQTTDPSTAMALAEAREWHQAQGYFPARAAEYGEDVRKRLEMGADVRAVDYLDAWQILAATHAACESLFGTVHAVLAPVTPVAATPIGTKVITLAGHEEPVRSALLRLCRPANFAHLPAISLPCGFTAGRLPIGLQLIGPRYGEESLCAVARVYEQAHAWRQARPELAS